MKSKFSPGEKVYACWVDGVTNLWYPAVVESFRVVGRTLLGEMRSYAIAFDDGTFDSDVEDYFVLSAEDYNLLLQLDQGRFPGISQYTTKVGNDGYAKVMGWYETDCTEGLIFSSLGDAIRARDNSLVVRYGTLTTKEDLNLANDWAFFKRRAPKRKKIWEPAATTKTATNFFKTTDNEVAMITTPTRKSKNDNGDNHESPICTTKVATQDENLRTLVTPDRAQSKSGLADLMSRLQESLDRCKDEMKRFETRRMDALGVWDKNPPQNWKDFVQQEKAEQTEHMKKYDKLMAEVEQIRNSMQDIII
eukprot:scaffold421239_cov42-Attheya_sp.AAC.1